MKTKWNIATELRDNIELYCHGEAYNETLKKLVPLLLKLLDGPPVFVNNVPEQVSHSFHGRTSKRVANLSVF